MFSAWNCLVKRCQLKTKNEFLARSLRKFRNRNTSDLRCLNSAASPAVDSNKTQLSARDLEVRVPRWPHSLTFNFTWLRDHCRCPKCYDQETAYKIVDLRQVGLDFRPKHAHVVGDQTLNITWEDDHETIHNLDWLWQHATDNYKERVKIKRTLWDRKSGYDLPLAAVSYDHFVENEELLKNVINSLHQYGLACVQTVKDDGSMSSIARVTERIAILRPSIFGRHVTLSSDANLHHPGSDVLISSAIRTAQAYLTEPGRIRVIQNVDQQDSKEVLLIDGFNLVEQMQQQNRLLSNVLRDNIFSFVFKHDLWHYHTDNAIVKDDFVTSDILQFRFNPLVMRLPESPNSFHEQLISEVTQYFQDPSFQHRMTIPPGAILLVDNWRVPLGFARSSNWRTAAMAFIGHSDFMSKARLLGLIA